MVQKVILEIVRTIQNVQILKSSEVAPITIHEKVSRDICINFVHKFSFEPEFSFSEIIFPRMVWKKKNFNHFGTFCLRNLYVANFYLIFLRQEFLREEKNDSRGLRSAVIYSRSIFYRT